MQRRFRDDSGILALLKQLESMSLLCCGLLSLAHGGSTTGAHTAVAGGFHLLHCSHCCVIIPHIYATVTVEGTSRRSESETIAAVHENRACLCPFFWARSFLSSGSVHISRLKHRCAAPSCVLRCWCFFFSPHPPLPSASTDATATEAPAS